MVSARYVLNFRESPAGRFISLYLGSSEAVARTENWFQVEYLGETGWISAHFVTTEGDCELAGSLNAEFAPHTNS